VVRRFTVSLCVLGGKVIDLNYGENYRKPVLLKKKLEDSLAKFLNVSPIQVMLNYGANSNLLMILSAYSLRMLKEKKRKLKILLDVPNYFFTLEQIKEWFIDVRTVERDANMDFPLDAFIKQISTYNPDIILLTTPNNPTGKPIKDEWIKQILEASSRETILLVDRACVNIEKEISTKDLITNLKNKIIVSHSFSKSHSLSDERVGYIVTNDLEIASFLGPKRDIGHNLHALKKLSKVLDSNLQDNKIKIIRKCNEILKLYFKSKSSRYYESSSNFALIKLSENLSSKAVEEFFLRKNILIMGGSRIGLGNHYIRVHMSGVKEIKKFVSLFDKLE
jgi:histidinol-phosphate/aromatic aminotransferase/cobyric acid decarboxylase-like protein